MSHMHTHANILASKLIWLILTVLTLNCPRVHCSHLSVLHHDLSLYFPLYFSMQHWPVHLHSRFCLLHRMLQKNKSIQSHHWLQCATQTVNKQSVNDRPSGVVPDCECSPQHFSSLLSLWTCKHRFLISSLSLSLSHARTHARTHAPGPDMLGGWTSPRSRHARLLKYRSDVPFLSKWVVFGHNRLQYAMNLSQYQHFKQTSTLDPNTSQKKKCYWTKSLWKVKIFNNVKY